MELISTSSEETELLGKMLGRSLFTNTIICFEGDLGAGKTTFIKGLASQVTENNEIETSSPTFTYLNIYEGKRTVYHFDLYRLKDSFEFLSMGFDEYFTGICCIEWAKKIQEILPTRAIFISMEHIGEETRRITIKNTNIYEKNKISAG